MSETVKDLLGEYFRECKDLGEEGLWYGKKKLKMKEPFRNKNFNKFEELEEKIKSCRKCKLGSQRINACFGSGDPSARLMFVGEGPGYNEDHRGEVFVGRAGKLLKKIIKEVFNLERDQVYITNIVKCHPMKDPSDPEKRGNDRPPTDKEAESCIGYLYRQIEILKPDVIVTLGAPASKTLLESNISITNLRGKVYEKTLGNTRVKIVPTYHPAYLLRSPSKKAETFKDTKLIKGLL
ncbi:MAG: uracil-DNA glycosylase [Elusimicrobia bacterium]|jgi:uracil-DNA glycosylase family 4|nr:uracil-DNA glycosylase [Elusimicrobiota bacterium]